MMDERPHEREHVGVVGRARQHQAVIAERIAHGLRHVAAGQIVEDDGLALRVQLIGEQPGGLHRAAVDGGAGDGHAVALRAVGRPAVIQRQVGREIVLEHRAVQRADGLHVERGELFKQRLHLRAVFAHDADVVPACLVRPVRLNVQRAELAERIRREERFLAGVVGDEDLRPVYHRRGEEAQFMPAQRERVALLDGEPAVRIILAEERLHHRKRLGGGDDCCLRISVHERLDAAGVVRLHVLHDQVIRRASAERLSDMLQPFPGKMPVHAVHHRDLSIHNRVGVVRHAVWHGVLPLKQIDFMVVDADVPDVACLVHVHHSSCIPLRSSFCHLDGAYSRMRPSVVMVTTRQGRSLPLAAMARRAACSMPPQQGTSMRATVTLLTSLPARMAASFWA